jgi:hypothetical protein
MGEVFHFGAAFKFIAILPITPSQDSAACGYAAAEVSRPFLKLCADDFVRR